MISVILTTYNGAQFVIEQLRSLLTQTLPADEVLILDDCSTDGTAEIVMRFINENRLSKWTLTVNLENVGYRKNFAKGLSQATGDIIFLCDQDDVWHKNKIERTYAVFSEHPDAMSVNTSFRVIDIHSRQNNALDILKFQEGRSNYSLIPLVLDHGTVTKIRSVHISPPSLLIRSNISPGCTMAVRAVVKNRYLAYTENMIPHDWELNIIADSMDGMYFLNDELIDYRIHENNTIGLPLTDGLENEPFMVRRIARHKVVSDAILSSVKYISDSKTRRMLSDYAILRNNALESHKLGSLIKLYCRHMKFCEHMLTTRGMLGDLYAVVAELFGR